ncbi:MAG: hypothetical protein ACW987_20730 [Candidatus Thorarchaeota archaeon]
MSMVVEKYQIADVVDTEVTDKRFSEREQLAAELGLSTQIALKDSEKVEFASEIFPQLNRRDLLVWGIYLPKRYLSTDAESWTGYKFDTIPLGALQQLQIAQSSGLFNHLEIWTPEAHVLPDPIAVGTVDTGRQAFYHLVVRWGESLKPFSEIKKSVVTDERLLDLVESKPEMFEDTGDILKIRSRRTLRKHCGERQANVCVANRKGSHRHRRVCLVCKSILKVVRCECFDW